MIKNISVGIDVGSANTRVVIAEFLKGETYPKILGVGESETFGIKNGCIISIKEVSESIKKAVSLAEKTSGIKIKRAFIGINNTSLKGELNSGIAVVSKADGEVTNLDIEKATEEAKRALNLNNKKIIQTIPVSYKLDNNEIFGKVEGYKGNKLEARILFITCLNAYFDSLIEALAEVEIEPIDVIPLILSTGDFILDKKQKMVGSSLANIGAETTSFATFENNTVTSLQVFPIGAENITNDIAIRFKTTLQEAENLKINESTEKSQKKKIEDVIEARMQDIFDLIQTHLKKIKRNSLLPSGVVFVGGGANTRNLEQFAKKFLDLPSRIGNVEMFTNVKTKLKEPAWLPVVSLLFIKLDENSYQEKNIGFKGLIEKIKKISQNALKQLMP